MAGNSHFEIHGLFPNSRLYGNPARFARKMGGRVMRWCWVNFQFRAIWITVGQGLTALAVGAGGGCLDIFTLTYPFSPLSPSLFRRRPDID